MNLFKQDLKECVVWALWNGTRHCSAKELKKNLSSGKLSSSIDTFDFDYIYPHNCPRERSAVLYADIFSPVFSDFHDVLMERAAALDLCYILRYQPMRISSKRMNLGGYGVELAIKSTEYTVIDDRDRAEEGEKNINERSNDNEQVADQESANSENAVTFDFLGSLDKGDIIIQSVNASDLKDFPLYASAITKVKLDPKISKLSRDTNDIETPYGSNKLFSNGLEIELETFDLFRMIRLLQEDLVAHSYFDHLKLSKKVVMDLLSVSDSEDPAFSWGDTFDARSKSVVWWNDLEKDKRYRMWPKSIREIMRPAYGSQLRYLRKNLFSVLLVLDLSNVDHLHALLEIFEFIDREIPLRFGLLPAVHGTDDKQPSVVAAVIFNWLSANGGKKTAKSFILELARLLKQESGGAVLDIVIEASRSLVSKSLEEVYRSSVEVLGYLRDSNKALGISLNTGAVFFNGKFIPLDEITFTGPNGLLQANADELDLRLSVIPSDPQDPAVTRVVELFESYSGRGLEEADFTKLRRLIVDGNDEGTRKLSPDVEGNFRLFSKLLQESTRNLSPSSDYLILNGRAIGPISENSMLTSDDLDIVINLDFKKVVLAMNNALQGFTFPDGIGAATAFMRIGSAVGSIKARQKSEKSDYDYVKTDRVGTEFFEKWIKKRDIITIGKQEAASWHLFFIVNPVSPQGQKLISIAKALSKLPGLAMTLVLNPDLSLTEMPLKRFYRYVLHQDLLSRSNGFASFRGLPEDSLLTMGIDAPKGWVVRAVECADDLDNIKLSSVQAAGRYGIEASYELRHILVEGHVQESRTNLPPRGVQFILGTPRQVHMVDTITMTNLGYIQLKANPGIWNLALREGRSQDIFKMDVLKNGAVGNFVSSNATTLALRSFEGVTVYPTLKRHPGRDADDVLEPKSEEAQSSSLFNRLKTSVMKQTKSPVKFWLIENFLSPSFMKFIPVLAEQYGFEFEFVTYKWPHWLRGQVEKQRFIWGYKILFLDVLFPLDLDKVIFVDADQIVRTDLKELMNLDLQGAVYGYTPFCDSRTEMDGFRFWKTGYWKNALGGRPYHISALYVIDLKRFRQFAAGDRLRQQYQMLSADPNSLANLDQDLPNSMMHQIPMYSLPQEWLWCETWCSDQELERAKTIDLCNNPLTKEPKLERARRLIPEWDGLDKEIQALAEKQKSNGNREETANRHDEL
ncbi:hypothetical protein HDU67_003305 [Dinochytrium kinnereticum]|nr:hypothetical protein HDU67_003305 [Dinochytrium kinnereticum]